MPAFRRSVSSRNNLLPYIKNASSKLSISALNSTTSLGALFTSSTSTSGSSKSVFMSGIRNIVTGRDKENATPHRAEGKMNMKGKPSKEKAKKGAAYPEISAPQITPEALEAVKARFTLVPLAKVHPSTDEIDLVIIEEVDFQDAPSTQKE